MRPALLAFALCALTTACEEAPDRAAGAAPPVSTEPAPAPMVDDLETLGGEMPPYAFRLLSNPYVEASYLALPADASVHLRNGEHWVVYAYSPATVSVDGTAAPAEWGEGTATFFDTPTRITNAGGAPAQLLFFERWANPLPDRQESPKEDVRFPVEMMRLDQVDSPAIDVLVSNDRVGVARVSLEPGEGLPPHSAFSRVVVALSEFEAERSRIEEFGGDSPDVRVRRPVGSVTWDTARNYAVKNVGGTTAKTLVVSYYE